MLVDMDHQRVAGLGALDVERTGLRIDLGQVELRRRPSCRMTENTSLDASRVLVITVSPGLMRMRRRMGIAIGELDLVARIVFDFGRDRPARPRATASAAADSGTLTDARCCQAVALRSHGYLLIDWYASNWSCIC